MKVSEIENMIKACNFYVACQTEKSEKFLVLDRILQVRNQRGRVNAKEWDGQLSMGYGLASAYEICVLRTLEDRLAELAIVLFSLAHKYQMNMESLKLGKTDAKTVFLDDLLMSMVKIEMSHYKVYKKIIILIGMLCDYCISNSIELRRFVEQRIANVYND